MNLPPLEQPDLRVGPGQRGFTLIEILVVVAILAIISRAVLSNLGSIVPSTTMDAEAQRLMSTIDYLRSEAELQGKTYKLELDLDNGRFREIWPAEMKVALDQDPNQLEEQRLGWLPIDERCRFGGYAVLGEPTLRRGRIEMLFNRNGNTADQVIFFRMKSDQLQHMVWTIQIRGLERGAKLVRDEDDREAYLERIEEAHF